MFEPRTRHTHSTLFYSLVWVLCMQNSKIPFSLINMCIRACAASARDPCVTLRSSVLVRTKKLLIEFGKLFQNILDISSSPPHNFIVCWPTILKHFIVLHDYWSIIAVVGKSFLTKSNIFATNLLNRTHHVIFHEIFRCWFVKIYCYSAWVNIYDHQWFHVCQFTYAKVCKICTQRTAKSPSQNRLYFRYTFSKFISFTYLCVMHDIYLYSVGMWMFCSDERSY